MSLRNRNVYNVRIKKEKKDGLESIKDLLRQAMSNTPSYIKEKHKKEISSILPELGFPTGLKLDLKDNHIKYRVYNRITNYLSELSQGKTIYLLVDDLQNGDIDFLKFLDYLVVNSKNRKIISIFALDRMEMDQEQEEIIKKWESDLQVPKLDLKRLNLEQTKDLIQNILGIEEIRPEFPQILFKESMGSPKRIVDMLNYLYQDKQLYINKNARWALGIDDFSEIYIPNKLAQSIYKELDSVEEDELKILRAIAGFNDPIPEKLLEDMVSMDGDMGNPLKGLINRKLIEKNIIKDEPFYKIEDIGVKKYIYFNMDQEEREKIHKKALHIIEENRDCDLFEEKIHHLKKLGEKHRAVDIILSRIDSLDYKNGYQGEKLLLEAYSILDKEKPDQRTLEVLEKILDIHSIKDILNQEDPRLVEYIALGEKLKSSYHRLNYRRLRAEIYCRSGYKDLFYREIQEIKRLNRLEKIVEFELYSIYAKGKLELKRGNYPKSETFLKEALDLALICKLDEQKGDIYNEMGNLAYRSGRLEEAKVYYEKSYEIFQSSKNIMKSLKPILNLGSLYYGYLAEKGLLYFEKGLEISRNNGCKKMEIIFLINLSEIRHINYDYKGALAYLLEAKDLAIKIQDEKLRGVCQAQLGILYLKKEEYQMACESYNYLNLLADKYKDEDLGFNLSYNNFLGSFYLYLGQWDKSKKYIKEAMDLIENLDKRQYYKLKFKMFLADFFKNKKIDPGNIEKFIDEYKETIYVDDYRKLVLIVALLNVSIGDLDKAKDYLELDKNIKAKSNQDFLDKLSKLVEESIKLNGENIDQYVDLVDDYFEKKEFPHRTIFLRKLATIYAEENRHRRAIKYYIEILENIYKNILKVSNSDFMISYIKSEDADKIIESLYDLLEKHYDLKLEKKTIDSIAVDKGQKGLESYFNIRELVNKLGKEEFYKIMETDIYEDAVNIEDVESLMIRMKDDYIYNLNLILKYLAKETFASKAYVLEYNEKSQEYEVISSLDGRDEGRADINYAILKIATRSKKGLLVRSGFKETTRNIYDNLLSKVVTGIICLPVSLNGLESVVDDRRHRDEDLVEYKSAYIYLETDRLFNNFTEDILDKIISSLHLIHLNLEISLLKKIGAVDNLTGAYTRKFYDEIFDKYIMKNKNLKFSVLMMDLDRFKRINDQYGHSKGDQVLKEVGRVIKSTIRSTDIFGRYGGEEFVVVLKDTGKREAEFIADKIRRNVENLEIEGIKYPITISGGIAIYPDHARLKDELVEKADKALYYSKENGRNLVSIWNSKMENIFLQGDKLAGIVTGSYEMDQKNILGLVTIIDMVKEDLNLEEKTYKFLGELLAVLEGAKWATIIVLDKYENKYYTRTRTKDSFVQTPKLNQNIIDRVLKSQKGEFLIDWENQEELKKKLEVPEWQSLIVIPMILGGKIKGIAYIAANLKDREFDFNDFSLSKHYTDIFASLL